MVARFEKMGDLFAPVLGLKQWLPDLKKVAASAAVKSSPKSRLRRRRTTSLRAPSATPRANPEAAAARKTGRKV